MKRKLAFTYLHLSQNGLFVLAAVVWFVSGTILINKGFEYIPSETSYQCIKIPMAFLAGLLFYYGVFTRIMTKYTEHIRSHSPQQKHPPYKVFRCRFYLMIAVMISSGVILRKTAIVPIEYLALFYFTMGTPLLISSFGFLQQIKKAETR